MFEERLGFDPETRLRQRNRIFSNEKLCFDTAFIYLSGVKPGFDKEKSINRETLDRPESRFHHFRKLAQGLGGLTFLKKSEGLVIDHFLTVMLLFPPCVLAWHLGGITWRPCGSLGRLRFGGRLLGGGGTILQIHPKLWSNIRPNMA